MKKIQEQRLNNRRLTAAAIVKAMTQTYFHRRFSLQKSHDHEIGSAKQRTTSMAHKIKRYIVVNEQSRVNKIPRLHRYIDSSKRTKQGKQDTLIENRKSI